MRDDWTTPACWVSDTHIALWGLAEWDDEKFKEAGHGTGVRILDTNAEKQAPGSAWPMAMDDTRIVDLFSDGKCLYVAADTGTTVWDLASRSQIASLPDFTARLYDIERGTLVAFGPATISEFPLRSLPDR